MTLVSSRVKWITWMVLAVLGILIVLQNTQAVETRLLFITIVMPRAALLALTLLIGFLLGTLTVWRAGRKKS